MDELRYVIDVAVEVGTTLRDRFWSQNIQSRLKTDHSIVTEADTFADEFIIRALHDKFPQDGIISEEKYPRLTHASHAVWVIDPLDGTANFSNQIPIWGVSIARLIDGFPELGVLYFPLTDEIYAAQKDRGATLNGAPLITNLDSAVSFFSCCSRTHRKYRTSVPYKTRILGSVAFNLASVARGSAAISIEVAPKIWDVAAAWIIVQEAGAVMDILAGHSPFPVHTEIDYDKSTFSTIAAVSETELNKAYTWIQPKS
jgi:myo-inositol-1(or 4)-monophosphatase